MKPKILVLVVLLGAQSLRAEEVKIEHEGLGIESLMGGVGVARLGSLGSLVSNPSLLAWLPNKKEFLSTNQIISSKYTQFDSASYSSSPTVIPRYAAAGEHTGDFGYAYAFLANSEEIEVVGSENSVSYLTESDRNDLGVSAGFGKKISAQFALGVTLNLIRFSNEVRARYFSQTPGQLVNSSLRQEESIWSTSSVIGASYTWGSWVLGVSSSFNLLKFGHTSYYHLNYYSDDINQVFVESNRNTKSKFKILGTHQVGVQKYFEGFRFFLDAAMLPSYTDDEGNFNQASYNYKFGVETPPFKEIYKIYSGLTYYPEQIIESGLNGPEGQAAFLGGSRAGKHSLTFIGIGFLRSRYMERKAINFGTKFEY